MEIKQYIFKITYGSKKKKSQEKSENILKEMKIKIHHIKKKNTPYQNLRDTAKALLRGKCIAQMLTSEKRKSLK